MAGIGDIALLGTSGLRDDPIVCMTGSINAEVRVGIAAITGKGSVSRRQAGRGNDLLGKDVTQRVRVILCISSAAAAGVSRVALLVAGGGDHGGGVLMRKHGDVRIGVGIKAAKAVVSRIALFGAGGGDDNGAIFVSRRVDHSFIMIPATRAIAGFKAFLGAGSVRMGLPISEKMSQLGACVFCVDESAMTSMLCDAGGLAGRRRGALLIREIMSGSGNDLSGDKHCKAVLTVDLIGKAVIHASGLGAFIYGFQMSGCGNDGLFLNGLCADRAV